MTRQNVPISSLHEGDVIAIKNTRDGIATKSWQYALVITPPFKRAGQVQGVEVFMLRPHDPGEYIKNDPYHYMYGDSYDHQAVKAAMGLHGDKNWRLHYSVNFVPNNPAFLGLDGGMVRKTGSISNDPAFNFIIHHASTLNINHINSPVLDEQDRRQLGLRRSALLDRIAETGGVERGRNIRREAERQKQGADSYADMPQRTEPTGKKKVKPSKPLEPVYHLNISLDDAVKLNIVTRQLKNILASIKNENGNKITTLREAWIIATKQPELLDNIFDETNQTTMSQARASGLLEMPEASYQIIMKSFSDKRRKNNDPDPTVDSIYKTLFNEKNADPDRILGLFDDEDDALEVAEDIEEAWLSLPLNVSDKKPPKNLVSKIKKVWSAFANEAVHNPKRFSEAGVAIKIPDPSP